MNEYHVSILEKDQLTPNVFRLRLKRPAGYKFSAGQAIELAVDAPGFEQRKAPFTFTALNTEPYLELIFKSYPQHNGVTKKMAELQPGDRVIIGDAWDSYVYAGPGVFIAGGSGVTPFLAILRQLNAENKTGNNRLFFSNHTVADIILEDELRRLLGKSCIFLLSGENKPGYHPGRIDGEFLREQVLSFDQPFYLCGPDPFVNDIREQLVALGAKREQVIVSL